MTLCIQQCVAESVSYPEQEVKAAFIFNFMRFTDWPREKISDSNQPVRIFVIGDYTNCKTLKEMDKKQYNDKDVNVHVFKSYENIEDPNILKTSHVLFICSSQKKHTKDILKIVKNSNVLTISEVDNFLESGGIINFVKEDQKIRFEVNRTIADDEKLEIRSKLLKLATRVIIKNPED
ncbi:MAG: YfiR family protein [Sedimentisphaerales bacterium]|nr:YfiR family protein [Sedimentisphaerales bacterium]